ncbi:hypothetical protein HK096_004837, partial [Nowakowskiella sp. JEL0078]
MPEVVVINSESLSENEVIDLTHDEPTEKPLTGTKLQTPSKRRRDRPNNAFNSNWYYPLGKNVKPDDDVIELIDRYKLPSDQLFDKTSFLQAARKQMSMRKTEVSPSRTGRPGVIIGKPVIVVDVEENLASEDNEKVDLESPERDNEKVMKKHKAESKKPTVTPVSFAEIQPSTSLNDSVIPSQTRLSPSPCEKSQSEPPFSPIQWLPPEEIFKALFVPLPQHRIPFVSSVSPSPVVFPSRVVSPSPAISPSPAVSPSPVVFPSRVVSSSPISVDLDSSEFIDYLADSESGDEICLSNDLLFSELDDLSLVANVDASLKEDHHLPDLDLPEDSTSFIFTPKSYLSKKVTPGPSALSTNSNQFASSKTTFVHSLESVDTNFNKRKRIVLSSHSDSGKIALRVEPKLEELYSDWNNIKSSENRQKKKRVISTSSDSAFEEHVEVKSQEIEVKLEKIDYQFQETKIESNELMDIQHFATRDSQNFQQISINPNLVWKTRYISESFDKNIERFTTPRQPPITSKTSLFILKRALESSIPRPSHLPTSHVLHPLQIYHPDRLSAFNTNLTSSSPSSDSQKIEVKTQQLLRLIHEREEEGCTTDIPIIPSGVKIHLAHKSTTTMKFANVKKVGSGQATEIKICDVAPNFHRKASCGGVERAAVTFVASFTAEAGEYNEIGNLVLMDMYRGVAGGWAGVGVTDFEGHRVTVRDGERERVETRTVLDVCFSNDGSKIYSGGADGK